jgi:hypothetical protein
MTSEERLANLEQELAHVKRRVKRRNRRHLIAMLVVAGVAFLLALYPRTWVQDPKDLFCARELILKVVHAQEFILEDEDGGVCATLGMGDAGPVLRLLDETGKARAKLAVGEDGPELYLFDENGTHRAGLVVSKYGPGLGLYNETGEPRARLSADKEGSALDLYDENCRTRAMLNAAKDRPALNLYDANGKAIWKAP